MLLNTAVGLLLNYSLIPLPSSHPFVSLTAGDHSGGSRWSGQFFYFALTLDFSAVSVSVASTLWLIPTTGHISHKHFLISSAVSPSISTSTSIPTYRFLYCHEVILKTSLPEFVVLVDHFVPGLSPTTTWGILIKFDGRNHIARRNSK